MCNFFPDKNQIKKWLEAFIPQHIPNIIVILFLKFNSCSFIIFRLIHYLLDYNLAKKHYEHNVVCLRDSKFFTPGCLIENQSQWADVRFGRGKSNMSYSGCEIIAVANALISTGEVLSAEDMAGLINRFEKNGMVFQGRFGTYPMALRNYLRRKGYKLSSTLSTKVEKIQAIGDRFSRIIVTAYNDDKNIMAAVHTVCITKDENGKFVIHNGYRPGYQPSAPYDTLCDAIKYIDTAGNSSVIMTLGLE